MLTVDAYLERERAAYRRAGLITAAIINVNRERGKPPVRPDDFVPRRRRRKPQTPEEMAVILKALTLAMGGEVRRGH